MQFYDCNKHKMKRRIGDIEFGADRKIKLLFIYLQPCTYRENATQIKISKNAATVGVSWCELLCECVPYEGT